MTALHRVRVAFSGDADDAFMYYGIACGAVSDPLLEIVHETGDIEQLNRRAAGPAVALDLDVSAVSFAAWPSIAATHDLLAVGSSFGLGYGPKLVARRGMDEPELRSSTIGIPGERTTAALVLRLLLPGCRTREIPFQDIPRAVAAGDVEAGVVIHEGQLTYHRDGLVLLRDLGEWWQGHAGHPLPLGANAVRRDLDAEAARRFSALLRSSIRHALDNRRAALEASVGRDSGLDLEEGSRYVAMYVNELSLDPGESGRAAVEDLLGRGADAGLLERVTPRWA